MTLAIDSSSPIRWTGTPANNVDITSASFTPPAGALLVVCASFNETSATPVEGSVSDSQSLTWTLQGRRNDGDAGGLNGGAEIWTAIVSTSTSMTVSVRRTTDAGGTGGTRRVSAVCYVVTGQHATPVPTVGEGSSTTNNLTASIFTSAFADSLAIVAGTEWNVPTDGVPVSSDLTEDGANYAGNLSVLAGHKTLGAAGAQTANLDAAGTGACEWNWVAIEVRDAGLPTITVDVTLVSAAAALASAVEVVIEVDAALLSGAAALAATAETTTIFSAALAAGSASLDGFVFFEVVHFDVTLVSPIAALGGEVHVRSLGHDLVHIRFRRGTKPLLTVRRD